MLARRAYRGFAKQLGLDFELGDEPVVAVLGQIQVEASGLALVKGPVVDQNLILLENVGNFPAPKRTATILTENTEDGCVFNASG